MLFVSGGSLFVGTGLSFVGGTHCSWVSSSSVGGGLMFVGSGSLSTSFWALFVVRGCQGEWGSLFKWVVGLGCGRCKSFVSGVVVRGWGAHVAGRRGHRSWVGIAWAPLVVVCPSSLGPCRMGVRHLESCGGHGMPGEPFMPTSVVWWWRRLLGATAMIVLLRPRLHRRCGRHGGCCSWRRRRRRGLACRGGGGVGGGGGE
jgi:hypothetical protein